MFTPRGITPGRATPLTIGLAPRSIAAVCLACGLAFAQAGAAVDEPEPAAAAEAEPVKTGPPSGTLGDGSEPETIWDAIAGGKISLDVRYRHEYADARGSKHSNANTIRTRLGYGTAAYEGLSFFAELEDIRAFGDEAYDPNRIEPIPARTFISDPEDTELNQAFVKYGRDAFEFVGGRQRIILDDARFIGNVGWRQNEQTFDAVMLSSGFDVEGLHAVYAYLWDVNRIFGDREQDGVGPPPGQVTRDFDSDSHAVNVSYDQLPIGKLTGFAYLLDLERKGDGVAVFSTNTYGLRLDGGHKVSEGVSLGYKLSYAWQEDTGNNPRDLQADYYLAEASADVRGAGTFIAGYEVLGADGTAQAFSTPLATLHKFQGWSDVLLGPSLTGGPIGAGAGIRDLYFGYVNNQLPGGLVGKVYYHRFETDAGGVDIGDEFDALLVKKINHRFDIVVKYAHFEANDVFADTDRVSFDLTFKF